MVKNAVTDFILNIRYIYLENLVSGARVENLQNYCRKHFGNFFSLTFFRSFMAVEKERVKLE